MRRFSIFAFFVLSAAAFSQSTDWKPLKTSPVSLAQKADKAILNLKNTYLEVAYTLEIPRGKGQGLFYSHFQSPSKFRAQFPIVRPNGKDPIQTQTLVVNTGQYYLIVPASKAPKKISRSSAPGFANPGSVLGYWPLEFQRMMSGSLVAKKPAFSDYVSALAKGQGGYVVKTQQRQITSFGKKFTTYRIFAQRSAAAAKKLGPSTVEMVFESQTGLPMTVRFTETKPKQKPTFIEWRAIWKGQNKFDPKLFRV